MHELSIAANILEIVEDNIKEVDAETVNELELEIGTLSGVVIDALSFALEQTKKDTVLENTKIIIKEIKAKVKCNNCNNIFEVDDFFTTCPKCDHFDSEIIQGKELNVKSLKVS